MWGSHRFTCGRPKSPFTVPPLSSKETAALWAYGKALTVEEDYPVVAGKTFFEIIRDLGLFEGTCDEVSKFWHAPALPLCTTAEHISFYIQLLPELLGEGSRLKEPFLSPCLLFARAFVANAIHLVHAQEGIKAFSRLPPSSTAWNTFASRAMPIVVEFLNAYPVQSTSTSPFERILPYLGQELVVSTLLGTGTYFHDSSQHYYRMKIAVRRLLEQLRQTSSMFQGDLKRNILKHIEYNERMLADVLSVEPDD